MIVLRPDTASDADKGDLDEVVAGRVYLHLEVLSDNAIMLIIQDESLHVQLRITHRGRSPLRVWEYERFALPLPLPPPMEMGT